MLAARVDVWLPLLGAKVARHAKGEQTAAEVDATFERAERDYFCKYTLSVYLRYYVLTICVHVQLSPSSNNTSSSSSMATPLSRMAMPCPKRMKTCSLRTL